MNARVDSGVAAGCRIVLAVASMALSSVVFAKPCESCCCSRADVARTACCAEGPKISVFAHYIRQIASQRKISIAEAADLLYGLGVRGFDTSADDKGLPELAATKLKPINLYFFPNMFAPDNGAADCRRCLDQAVKYGVPRVMVVPSSFTKDGDPEVDFAKDLSGMRLFVEEAKKRGITITVEDFGGQNNPCSYMKYLKRFLDEIPDLKFALDSGNLYYANRGEDILELMAYAKDRIAHVHLKDQLETDHHVYAELGLGGVPNERIVKAVNAAGYDGWYTLENTVAGADVYYETVRQTAVLKVWLKESAAVAR